jgi:2-dehydro-3-deoxygluconokinase
MAEVVTFGEAMVRLSPPPSRRLEQTETLEVTIGGAELNVAVGVARLGRSAQWVSTLPRNALGRMTLDRARGQGVGTDWVGWDDEGRMGLYFVEYGASPRPSSVLYDRAGSSFSRDDGTEYDWRAILAGARLFHTSGITPALGQRPAAHVRQALETARNLGLTVSYDLNYRARLWTAAAARAAQEPLMEFVDVLLTTEEDTRLVFGIEGNDYRSVARELAERFDLKVVTITLRTDHTVLRNGWTAIAVENGTVFDDRTYEIELIDRIGGGDAYAAGFILGVLDGDVAKGVRYGNAFSALKQTSWGDFPWATADDLEALIADGGSRIVR